jgi:hypothetical protein
MKICGEWMYSYTIIDLGNRWRLVVSFTPGPLLPQGKELSIFIGYEAGWVPDSV